HTAANLLGTPGAWLAQNLLDTFGVAVYVLLAAWFVLVLLLFLRRGVLTWTLRFLGWVLLVPCAALMADRAGPSSLGGPLWGSGGALGAWLAGWLDGYFFPPGRVAVLGGCVLVGVVLTADFLLLRLLRLAWAALSAPLGAVPAVWRRWRTRRRGTSL